MPKSRAKIAIFVSFALCLLYWGYLFKTARMEIIFDAISYENSGQLLYKQGWLEYFRTGPNREPLYPFLISISMRLADVFLVPYQSIQIFLQLIILFITQLLTLNILKKLKVSSLIEVLTILYIGFSPALVNSAFSLFSEIATYPFVLLIILTGVRSWSLLLTGSNMSRCIRSGFLLGILFILATCTKVTFQYILLFFLIPYIYLMFDAFLNKNKERLFKVIIFLVIFSATFFSFLITYKSLNRIYNGHYTFTDRGPYLLYGNTAKRLQELTPRKILTCAAYTLGEGLCYSLFDKKDCDVWNLWRVETLGAFKRQEADKTYLPADVDAQIMKSAISEALKNPLQYVFITSIESFKIFFWESTRIGCVTYPAWLSTIYNMSFFKNFLRLILSALSFISIVYVVKYIVSRRKLLISPTGEEQESVRIFFFIMVLMAGFLFIHLFFFLVTRYIFPIVPLFLICIAVSFQKLVIKK